MASDEYMTTEEVAELLRTSPSTVRYWRHTGQGPRGVRVGHRVIYARRDVDAWVERKRERERDLSRTDA